MKKSQSSTKEPKAERGQRKWEAYYDIFSWNLKQVDEVILQRVAQDLKNWADQDESLRIDDFIDSRGLCLDSYYKWQERCEELKVAHKYALRRIGSRREKGALTRKYDANSIFRTLAYYDPIYREERRIAAALKDENASQEPKIVIMHEYKKEEK